MARRSDPNRERWRARMRADLRKSGARATYGPLGEPAPVTIRRVDGTIQTVPGERRRKGKFQKRLEALGFRTYEEYLRSDHWRGVWRQYRESGRPMECWVCGPCDRFVLHHETYERLGSEELDDLTPLCEDCHRAAHDLVDTEVDGRIVALHEAVEVLVAQRDAATADC